MNKQRNRSRLFLVMTLFGLITLGATATSSHALLPAALPKYHDVEPSVQSAIDGDWILSVNNKRIRIDRGRAYALDAWQHALLWTIHPDMVVIRNIEKIDAGVYVGDDLPLLGRARIEQLANGSLDVTVGAVNYQLSPVNRSRSIGRTPDEGLDENLDGDVEEDYGLDRGQPQGRDPTKEDVPQYDDEPRYEDEARFASDRGDDRPVEKVYPSPEEYEDREWGRDLPGANPPQRNWPEAPKFLSYESFNGCDIDESGGPSNANPRGRLESRVDRITQRQFAGFDLDQAQSSTSSDEQLGLCWMRLDGVWQELGSIYLDREKDEPELWGTDMPELIVLANGNYSDLRHLYIGSVGRDDSEVWVSDGLSAKGFVKFVSNDGLSLEETLTRNGPVKEYVAKGRSYLGSRLRVDLTESGRPRIRLGNTAFLRPQLQISEAAMQEQIASNDAFLLQANMENLGASRKGYDAVKQDPFFLLQNRKMEVFANFDPKRYYIAEQRIIPVGYKFFQTSAQGMVYNKTMTTTATEYQKSIAVTLGATMKGSSDPAGFLYKGSASVDASVGWMERMQESKHVAQALGYSRAKKYALTVDHPFVSLSKNFIDAIGDARKDGDYSNIIRMFGTHYPYAVTYGAAAKISQSLTEESYQKLTQWNAGVSAKMAGGMMGQGGSVRASINSENVSGSSGSIGTEGATFVAVGGNGSWNENGYSMGATPYPILLDLRPLHELLNYMNFPDQPEVYNDVRAGLKRAIESYMARHANKVSDRSLLPKLVPKKIETWHLYVREAWCAGKGHMIVHDARGTVTMEAFMGNKSRGYKTAPHRSVGAKCKKNKKKDEVSKYSYKKNSPGLIEITGTREQIASYALSLRLKWRYTPSNRNKWRNHDKTYVGLSALKGGLAPGKSKDQIWKVGAKSKPEFVLRVRAKRIR